MKQKPKYAGFGYCRVSSEGQSAEDKDGIARQEAAISKWAAANNVRIARWFRDSVSGTNDLENRPALQELMAALHGNGTKRVLIEKLDRLARDLNHIFLDCATCVLNILTVSPAIFVFRSVADERHRNKSMR